MIQIPPQAKAFMDGLTKLAKALAAELDEEKARNRELEQLSKAASGDSPGSVVSAEQAFTWVDQLKTVGLVDQSVSQQKLAAHIQAHPEWLIDQLISSQAPPLTEGGPAGNKQASENLGSRQLVDHDGWAEAVDGYSYED